MDGWLNEVPYFNAILSLMSYKHTISQIRASLRLFDEIDLSLLIGQSSIFCQAFSKLHLTSYMINVEL